jgi:DNA-binding NarL/FixJ family response regulator
VAADSAFLPMRRAARSPRLARVGRWGLVEPVQPESAARTDSRIRVAIVDERSRSRHALVALLGTYLDVVVVGEAADCAAALDLVARERPDVVLMDVFTPSLDGLQATASIKQRFPRVRVVALSLSADAADQALAMGADACVALGAAEDQLLETVRRLIRPG